MGENENFQTHDEPVMWDPTIEPPSQEMIDTAPPGFIEALTDISWLARLDMLDALPQERDPGD